MSKVYLEMISGTVDAVMCSDTAEKEFFIEVYGELKSGDDYDTIVKSIKDKVSEVVIQRQIIMIVNMARDYVGSKLFTRILDMRWYNVKALVALIRYINKEHGASTIKAIKGKISKVGKGALNNGQYNNELAKVVAGLKSQYKAVITDDGKVITKSVTATYNGMTSAQKVEMLQLLMADVNEATKEVA